MESDLRLLGGLLTPGPLAHEKHAIEKPFRTHTFPHREKAVPLSSRDFGAARKARSGHAKSPGGLGTCHGPSHDHEEVQKRPFCRTHALFVG